MTEVPPTQAGSVPSSPRAHPAFAIAAGVLGIIGGLIALWFGGSALLSAGMPWPWRIFQAVTVATGCALVIAGVMLFRRRPGGQTLLTAAAAAAIVIWLIADAATAVNIATDEDPSALAPGFGVALLAATIVSLPFIAPAILALILARTKSTTRWVGEPRAD